MGRLEEASEEPSQASEEPSQDGSRRAGPQEAIEGLFERFPYGLFTVDGSGRILSVNRACREMLPLIADGPTSTRLTCCDLICQRLNDDDAPQCLTDEALAATGALPEIRIDLGAQSEPGAVWVTVSPLAEEGGVVFHLRPGETGDRRRRTEVHWGAAPRLRVFVLGPTRVETSVAGSIGGDWLEQRPGQLLDFLACARGRVVEADEIAQALWPDAGASALSSVRYSIHVLRARLEPAREARAPSTFIQSRRGGYGLDMQRVWLDVAEFEQLVGAGLAALVEGDRESALRRLERAMNLYRDDLLVDEPYAEWALAERNRLRELAARALGTLVELRLAAGDPNPAARHARRLADMEPYDSDAQRQHIELSLRRGRRSEAVRRYNLFRTRLRREFNEEPDFELADLPSPSESHGGEDPKPLS